jgi:hypothetical protein
LNRDYIWYFPYHFNIQLTFPPYFPYLFTIQLIFLPYFPNLINIQLSFLPYFPYLLAIVCHNDKENTEENSEKIGKIWKNTVK